MRDKVIGRTVRRESKLPLCAMKVAAISSQLLWLAVLLAGCTAAQASPTSFLFTDMSHLAFLHWSESVQGKVAGQEDMLTAPASLSATALPRASTTRFLGTFEHGQLSLRAGSLLLSGRPTAERLQLQRGSAAAGMTRQSWFAASQQQYHSLVAAFTVSLQLQGALNALTHLLAQPTADSNPVSSQLAVQQVRQYVSSLEGALTAIRTAASIQDRCDRVSQFDQQYPAAPETFQLPSVPQNSLLAHDLQMVQHLREQSQALALPRIDGLTLPWRISAQRVNAAVQAGQQAYRSLQGAYQQEEQAMTAQEREYQQIGQQVRPYQQSC